MPLKSDGIVDQPSGSGASVARRDALKAAVLFAAAPLSAQMTAGAAGLMVAPRRHQAFDAGWRFLRGDAVGAEQPAFGDSDWRLLDLPHDWSIEDLPPRPAEEGGAGAI